MCVPADDVATVAAVTLRLVIALDLVQQVSISRMHFVPMRPHLGCSTRLTRRHRAADQRLGPKTLPFQDEVGGDVTLARYAGLAGRR
jgi:hypothetical protein